MVQRYPVNLTTEAIIGPYEVLPRPLRGNLAEADLLDATWAIDQLSAERAAGRLSYDIPSASDGVGYWPRVFGTPPNLDEWESTREDPAELDTENMQVVIPLKKTNVVGLPAWKLARIEAVRETARQLYYKATGYTHTPAYLVTFGTTADSTATLIAAATDHEEVESIIAAISWPSIE